jgi:hypothetical protein
MHTYFRLFAESELSESVVSECMYLKEDRKRTSCVCVVVVVFWLLQHFVVAEAKKKQVFSSGHPSNQPS